MIIMQKTLYKVNQGKMVSGVCMGLSEYFNVDVNLVRIATVVACCMCGAGIVAYIAAAILLPEK